jgi:hypothetical protein
MDRQPIPIESFHSLAEKLVPAPVPSDIDSLLAFSVKCMMAKAVTALTLSKNYVQKQ